MTLNLEEEYPKAAQYIGQAVVKRCEEWVLENYW